MIFYSEPRPPIHFFIGLSLGSRQDYTALAIAQRQRKEIDGCTDNHYQVRHLERLTDMSYPKIADHLAEMMLHKELYGHSRLMIDCTGVALPVADSFCQLLRRKEVHATTYKILISTGDTETTDHKSYRVPRRDLASRLQVLLQLDRLKFGPVPFVDTLVAELESFQVRVSPPGTPDELIWREKESDDLVIAVAIACWGAERFSPGARSTRCYGLDF